MLFNNNCKIQVMCLIFDDDGDEPIWGEEDEEEEV